ncbi:hypothetical protein EMIT0P294_100128 [Pseudomonas sp. IT-P294]
MDQERRLGPHSGMHRRGPGAAGLIGFYLTPRCVFYGFTVRLVGAPFFFARKKKRVGAWLARDER